MTTPTTKNTKWLKISLIVGAVIGLICCIGIAALLFFANTMNNITQDNDTWVRSLAWSPDGSKIAVGSSNHTVTIWDVQSGRLLITISSHTSSVRDLAWSPDGKMLASGAGDGVVFIWNPQTGNMIKQLTTTEQDALGFLSWSPDSYWLAFTGHSGDILIWDVDNNQEILFFDSSGETNLKNLITGISWSPDGTRLAISTADGSINIRDIQTGESLWSTIAHSGWANDVEWSLDSDLLVSGGDDGVLKVWNAETGDLFNETKGSDSIFSVDWSFTSQPQIAWMSARGQVAITDFQQPDIFLPAGNDKVWVVAWSRDGQFLAAGTGVNTVYIWDTTTNQQIQLLTVPNIP
ncbi:MAG: WD40 repeat domain-containing protein [Anaerolineales bacterium]|nr:WD40 repeat domain-containing protein [Anaerolineales bacterium]